MPKVTEMFAFVICDKDDDDEGIVGVQAPTGLVPLIGADVARADSYRGLAAQLATSLGKPIRLVHFSGPPVVVDTIWPAGLTKPRAH